MSSGLPARPGRVVLGGAAIVAATFGAMWIYLQQKQARKAEPKHATSVPAWEYRLQSMANPGGPPPEAKPAAASTGVQHLFLPSNPPAPPVEPNRQQHRTMTTVSQEGEGEMPLTNKNGGMMHPTPQRDRGDGLAYTKRAGVFEQPTPGKNDKTTEVADKKSRSLSRQVTGLPNFIVDELTEARQTPILRMISAGLRTLSGSIASLTRTIPSHPTAPNTSFLLLKTNKRFIMDTANNLMGRGAGQPPKNRIVRTPISRRSPSPLSFSLSILLGNGAYVD
ncbi:hypothetical protein EW146_g8966 [Bondarzewia mesenterica]|uniref:Uncharacterized protein n=1 Tax=Bondarzewia mesenterica TaxID=1095465 RepID=A0A4S4LA57_9AGAM|nr:hypothetical protein EW146_g8966 [Bondarzewia mesenterica]